MIYLAHVWLIVSNRIPFHSSNFIRLMYFISIQTLSVLITQPVPENSGKPIFTGESNNNARPRLRSHSPYFL